MPSGPLHRRLTRQDWVAAAVTALIATGPGAIAIEPLAVSLGTTKGSGYHHFRSREELLDAALQEYRAEHAQAIIQQVEAAGGTPRSRLGRLFATVESRWGERARGSELPLLASTEPAVRAMMEQISAERIGYLRTVMVQAGFGQAEAHRRAMIAYLGFVGQIALLDAMPSVLPQTKAARKALHRTMIDTLLLPVH